MFVTPLVVNSDFEKRSIMTQAIGRASRAGQDRGVSVEHFVTEGVEVRLARDGCLRKRR